MSKFTNVQKNAYKRGRRWGYAVMRSATQTSMGAVMGADKAMKTCAGYARSGKRKGTKLTASERSGYQGVADGIYEYVRKHSR